MNEQALLDWYNARIELDFGVYEEAKRLFEASIKQWDKPEPLLNMISLLDDSELELYLYQCLQKLFPKEADLIESWMQSPVNLSIEARWQNYHKMARQPRVLRSMLAQIQGRWAELAWNFQLWRNRKKLEARLDAGLHNEGFELLFEPALIRQSQLLPASLLAIIAALPVRGSGRTRLKELLSGLVGGDKPLAYEQELVEEITSIIQSSKDLVLPEAKRRTLLLRIRNEIAGLSVLQDLMDDETVSDINIFGAKDIRTYRRGRLSHEDLMFNDEKHLQVIINRLVAPFGIEFNEENPSINVQFPNGTNVSALMYPLSPGQTVVQIRKFASVPLTISDLIRFGALSPEIAQFLRATVIAELNILFVGEAGSGIITLMNVLTSFIPNDILIYVIEPQMNVRAQQETTVYLRNFAPDGRKLSTNIELLDTAISMGADYLIMPDIEEHETEQVLRRIGSRRGAMLRRAARSTADAVKTIEQEINLQQQDATGGKAEALIANSINLIVEQQRLKDGSRKIVRISEPVLERGGSLSLNTIYEFEHVGLENNRIVGRIRPTGYRPRFLSLIEDAGIYLPPSTFGIGRWLQEQTYKEFSFVPHPRPILPHEAWVFKAEDEIRVAATFTPYGLCFGSYDTNIYMFDKQTGTQIWRYTTEGGIASQPAYDWETKLCIVGSEDSSIYAISAKTGRLEWSFITRSRICTAPSISFGHVFFGNDYGDFYALQVANGRFIWEYSAYENIRAGATTFSDRIVFASTYGDIYGLLLSGERKWQQKIGANIHGSLVPDRGDYSCYLTTSKGECIAIDVEYGKIFWTYKANAPYVASPLLHKQRLFLAATNGEVVALDSRTSKLIWKYSASRGFVATAQIIQVAIEEKNAEVLLLGDLDGLLHFLNPATGQKYGEFQLSAPVMGIAVESNVPNARFAITTLDGHAYCFVQQTLAQFLPFKV